MKTQQQKQPNKITQRNTYTNITKPIKQHKTTTNKYKRITNTKQNKHTIRITQPTNNSKQT